jgi:beta-glucanase (GH16 family)
MHRFHALIVATVLLLAGLSACSDNGGSPSTPAPSGTAPVAGWKLAWVEDFDGTSLDPTKWNVRTDTSNANENSFLLASNVSVANGVLRIQAKRQSAGGKPYTSGYIDTNGKYALPDQFRLEVEAKVPLEMGMWAAPVWLRPANSPVGEIDPVETYGADAPDFVVHQTLHDSYGFTHRQDARTVHWPDHGNPLAWHTYLIEKTTGQIKMYVDGVLTETFSTRNPSWYSSVFDQGKRWELRVNLQVGGARGLPDSTTDWSPDKTAMLLDHIYAWVKE